MPSVVKGEIWAVRITVTLSEQEENDLKAIPNSIIVYHHGGNRSGTFQEKPHYHFCIVKDARREDIAELLLANSVIKKYHRKSNSFWTIETKSEYTIQSYWEYVWKGQTSKRTRMVTWNIPGEQLPLPIDPLIVEGPCITNTVIVKSAKATSLDKQKKFYSYCKDRYDESKKSITPQRTIKYLYDYCGANGFTTEACTYTWVNYAMFHLLSGESHSQSRRDFSIRLTQKYFSS